MTGEDPWADGFNVFGDLDVEDIPDDPYHIDNNRYDWVVTKAELKKYELKEEKARNEAHANGEPDWFMRGNYTIHVDEPTSEFHGKPVQLQFMIYPWLTKGKLEAMEDLDRKNRIKENASRHMVFWRGIGLSESEIRSITPDTIASIVIGRKFSAYYKENTTSDGRKFKNLSDYKEVTATEQTDMTDWLSSDSSDSNTSLAF